MDKAIATQLANMQKRTGKSLDEFKEVDAELLAWIRQAYDAAV